MDAFKSWWQLPFRSDGSVLSWFLFTGLILVIIFLWTRILREAGHVIGEQFAACKGVQFMRMAMSFSGILVILLVLFIGFWLGKNRPSLLGGFP